jgi:hypothetical protein
MVVTGVFVFAGIAGAQDCIDDPISQYDKCKQVECCEQTGFPNVCDIGAQGCETLGSQGCPNLCGKCEVKNIPCQGVILGDQGSKSNTPSCRFDYDESYGYCGPNVEFEADGKEKAVRNCKFYIDICECPDACEITVGNTVGIQMVLKVNGQNAGPNDGVYWAQDPNLADRKLHFQSYLKRSASDLAKTCTDEGKNWTRFFGDIRYYSSLNFVKAQGLDQGVGRAIYTTGSEVQPYSSECITGPMPAANRATVLESGTDYTISAADVNEGGAGGGVCIWMIDIPSVIIDSQAKAGATISVEVRLLWNKENQDKLCDRCEVSDICKCEREIAIVCCETKANNVGCLFFPYVLQGLRELPEDQSGGWVSGVAISARPLDATTTLVLPEGAFCKLTLRDTEGNTATWTNNELGNGLVWAFVLDSILPKFSKSLKPGACSLMVETNYPIDGYTFMNANMQFGAGELPRGCYGAVAP